MGQQEELECFSEDYDTEAYQSKVWEVVLLRVFGVLIKPKKAVQWPGKANFTFSAVKGTSARSASLLAADWLQLVPCPSVIIGSDYELTNVLMCVMNRGACGNMADELIYLCFDYDHDDECWSAADPLGDFNQITSSSHSHSQTRTANSDSKPTFSVQITYHLSANVGCRKLLSWQCKVWDLRQANWNLDWLARLSLCC